MFCQSIISFICLVLAYKVLEPSKKTKEADLPLYSWSIFRDNSYHTRKLIYDYNGNYNEVILKEEVHLISAHTPFLEYKNSYVANNPDTLDSNYYRLQNICSLDDNNQIQFLLKQHPPIYGKVVIDIGSGLGQCSRQLALLGYKVFSIEKDQQMMNWQKHNFCAPIAPETFVYFFWKQNNPQMLNQDIFNNYCKQVKENKVHFITDNFVNSKALQQIIKQYKKWDIVLGLMSLQFFNSEDRRSAFEIINKHQTEGGVLILSTQPKNTYKNVKLFGGVYDFSLKEMLYNPIVKDNYKVLLAQDLFGGSWLHLLTFIKQAKTKQSKSNKEE